MAESKGKILLEKLIDTYVSRSNPITDEQDRFSSLSSSLLGQEEFTLDPHGIIISSNLEAVSITGYEEWEVINKHFSIFYTEDDVENGKPEEDMKKARETGGYSFTDIRLKRKRAPFLAKGKLVPLRNQIGVSSGFKMTLKDATHKTIKDVRFQRLKDEFSTIINNSAIGIFKFNIEDGKVTLFNDRAMEIIDRHFSKNFEIRNIFLNNKDYELFINHLSEKKEIHGFEFLVNNEGVGPRWASIDCKYLVQEGFVEGILIDISTVKKQTESIDQLNNQINTFIYHASHDFRAPLATILGVVNLMKLEGGQQHYSEMIRERVLHLDSLLKDLVAILFNNQSEIRHDSIDFTMEAKTVLKSLDVLHHNIKTQLKVEQDGPFLSDTIRIRTILRNLFSNAVKYSNPLLGDFHIRLNIRADESSVLIEVEDNGVGIDERDLMEVFQLFHRGSANPHGSGLGLYIVKSMVETLQGTIDVESGTGLGSKFRIRIPNLLGSKG